MGAVISTRRINKPLISLALLQVGFEPSNLDTAVPVELASNEPMSKKRYREEEVEEDKEIVLTASIESTSSIEVAPLSKNEIKRRIKAQKLAQKKADKGVKKEEVGVAIRLWCEKRDRVLSILSKSEMSKLGIELLEEKPFKSRSVYVNAAYYMSNQLTLSSSITSNSQSEGAETRREKTSRPVVELMLFSAKLLFVVHSSMFTGDETT